ncbi:helix-turn-helix domain-containing protein [Bilifractor sp. LCP21S3_A7]|uniref:helix-turn-helix domain-containing protein n=1 Tax=Bilifractor sp. LCP21S3_A7 TaxID=3438738 RepID=UPI003F92E37F
MGKQCDFEFANLGQVVKKLRKEHGLTQVDVARTLNVTPGYISNVENSRTEMSLRMLCYYGDLTGLTLDELVGKAVPAYRKTSLDHKISRMVEKLGEEDKQKVIDTLSIWTNVE